MKLTRNKADAIDVWATYDVVEIISEGAYANVWKGVHIESQKEVALKIVDKDQATMIELKQVVDEVTFLKKLNHPNIISLVDFFDSNKTMVLVLPLMNCTLDEYLEKLSEQISDKEAIEIFKKISMAIDYCHTQFVMHGDIKMENILVKYNAADMTITELLVSDFGLAIDLSNQNKQRQLQGTLPYIAPELFLSKQPFNTQCESWSLGVLLHELLLFEQPFYANNEEELIEKILIQEIQYDDQKWEGIPIETLDLLENLLQKNPNNRLPVLEISKQSCLIDIDLNKKMISLAH